ncbi:hypothetical protein, partial [Weissella soli]|uniref:hypothetical protein n=1 Tax=Weissella soli TaxID=155866 RepID=UPI00359F5E7D
GKTMIVQRLTAHEFGAGQADQSNASKANHKVQQALSIEKQLIQKGLNQVENNQMFAWVSA